MRALLSVALASLAAATLLPAASAVHPETVVYTEDFVTPLGPEWSSGARWTTGGSAPGRTLGGPYANLAVTLDVGSAVALPAHDQVTVVFELYVLNSMDGHGACCGPDVIRFAADGDLWMDATFCNFPGSCVQSYPDDFVNPPGDPDRPGYTGADEAGVDYGSGGGHAHRSAKYTVARTFAHTSSALVLSWTGAGQQGMPDEGWSVDTVRVAVHTTDGGAAAPIPELTTLALVGAGVVGVAAVALRRR